MSSQLLLTWYVVDYSSLNDNSMDTDDNFPSDENEDGKHPGGLIDKLILLIGLILEGNVLNLSQDQITGLVEVANVLRSPDGRLHVDNLLATVDEEEDIYDDAL